MYFSLGSVPLLVSEEYAQHDNIQRELPPPPLHPQDTNHRDQLLEILSQTDSVSCLIVWTCSTWTFIRFYNCLKRHRDDLSLLPQFAHVWRFARPSHGSEDTYPWRSHGQPLTKYVALVGCLFTLVVADGAALWNGFRLTAFLAAYLAVRPFPSGVCNV